MLYYKRHKMNFKRGGSYIDSSGQIKTKKAAVNSINKNSKKCFQYYVTVALNHENWRRSYMMNITQKDQISNQEKMMGKKLMIAFNILNV